MRGGKLPLIKLLLQCGAQTDALDESGLTPLLHLSKTRSKADPIPVMELLVANGANVDARDRNACNQSGKTAAEIGRKHAGIVWMLSNE